MRIGGLQSASLIDYPGEVAAVVFTIGCNFRCPYCHNPELVIEAPEREISVEEAMEFLRSRAHVLPAVVVTGGEPTLHDDLPDFLRAVKALGYRIKLDSNGTNPAMLRQLCEEGVLDYIAMDIKAPLARYAAVVGAAVEEAAIQESIDLLRAGAVPYEFRTTIVRSQLSPDDIRTIGRELEGARAYYLQQFNPGKTLHPSFRSKLSYSREELEGLAREVSRYVEYCDVRA